AGGCVDDVAVLTGPFRRIERLVGAAEELVRRLPGARLGDPEAGAELNGRVVRDRDRRGRQSVPRSRCNDGRGLGRRLGKQDRELLASEPGCDVEVAHLRAEELSERLESTVAA